MTDKLPPNLLALFAPRPPLRWVKPVDHPPQARRTQAITGTGHYLEALKEYKEDDTFTPTESWLEARDRKKVEKKEAIQELVKEAPTKFQPADDPNIRGHALSTMVVARLSYEADERDLERHFNRFGPIERIRIITDTHAHEKPNKKKKAHRGYAFIVFERESDMQAAVRACDGDRIKGRAIKTDVERGRTVVGWKPRRLGGGLGGRGYTRAMSSRPVGPRGFGDGFRDGGFRDGGFRDGGFRGGFRGGFDGGRPRGGGRGGRGGGFRGDFGGPRSDRNSLGPPTGAPSGPGFDRRNGDRGGFSGPGYEARGSGRFDDRGGGPRDAGRFGDRDGGRRTGSNMEPVAPRREGGYRDRERDRDRDRERDRDRDGYRGGDRDRGRDRRDFDRPRDDDSRKRPYEGAGYDESRKAPRY